MQISEHILLESDEREVPALGSARKTHAQVAVTSRLRRCVLQLEIIDYYYLSVRSRSPSGELGYVLDLRFVAAPPRVARHVARRWINASLVLLALAAGMAAWIRSSATPWWQHGWLRACAAVTGMWVLATVIAAYRTTDTVRLYSAHGAVRVLEFTGGMGTFRALRPFLARLVAHIRLAVAARRRTRAEHLRDEMREHGRLRDVGVLSAEEYEAGKMRILAHHTPATPARAKRPPAP
ncbi:MAG: hypothetical protein E6K24_15000 [Gammaproteobacteria bacterium]|nr:MAG: hypothetical protein E6K24_15000 [Gammaproteobacteria bacterium]